MLKQKLADVQTGLEDAQQGAEKTQKRATEVLEYHIISPREWTGFGCLSHCPITDLLDSSPTTQAHLVVVREKEALADQLQDRIAKLSADLEEQVFALRSANQVPSAGTSTNDLDIHTRLSFLFLADCRANQTDFERD